jgi:hypothetical protein
MLKMDVPESGDLSLTIASFDSAGKPHGHLSAIAERVGNPSEQIEICAQF